MNKRKRYVTALALTLASPAYATSGMRLIGFGPVQDSMGGVGVAATLDSACMVTNPAGMTELGGRLDFGASYFKPTVQYSATGIDASVPPPQGHLLVNQPGVTFTSDKGASPIPAFGVLLPIDQNWTFGLGAYAIAGMGVDYPQNLYSSITYSAYSQMRFTPSIAYKLSDLLSFGITLNGMWATTEWSAAGNFGQAPHLTASSFGIGATIGAKVMPLKILTIGVAYETKSFFQDFSYNTASRSNPLNPSGSPLPGGVDKLTFDQPQVLTGGVAVRPIGILLVAADVEWIDWPQTNGANLPAFSQNSSQAMPWNLNWSSQVVYKIGVQVDALSWLTVRAGYNYGKEPLDSSRAFENIAFPAIAESHITAGLGIGLSPKFTINIGGMYAPQVTVTGANANPPLGTPGYTGPYGQGIASYSTSMSQFSLDGGIAYRF